MNENYEHRIPLKRQTIIFIPFALIFLASLFIGAFLPRFLSEDFLISQANTIALHFETPIAYSDNTPNILMNSIFKSALADIFCVFIIFIFSFSIHHSIISGIVLIYIGLRNGCTATLVCMIDDFISNTYSPKFIEICIFLFTKAIIVLFILRYILKSCRFAVSFNEKCAMHSDTLKFMFTSLSNVFLLCALHGAYGFLIKSI